MPPHFDAKRVYHEGSYARSILKAREDLEADYGSHVVIWSKILKPGLEIESITPLLGQLEVIRGGSRSKLTPLEPGDTATSSSLRASSDIHITKDSWITFTRPAVVNGSIYVFSSKNTADWMGRLRESGIQLPLSGLTIPGTHNTMALVGKAGDTPVLTPMAECQDYSLVEQLLMGVRSVDFRLGYNFELRHGRAYLFSGRLPDALDAINSFLDAHPGETVIVGAKWDMEDLNGNRHPEPETLRLDIEKLFFSYSSALDITTPPMLSDTRGKMLLLAQGKSSRGIHCDGPSFQPSIPENLPEKDRKWEQVNQNFAFNVSHKEIDKKQWYHVAMNGFYVEKVGDVFTGKMIAPRYMAEHINPRASAWVGKNCGGGERVRLGRVELDFANPEFVLQLVKTNFL